MKYHKIPAIGTRMGLDKQDLDWMQSGLQEAVNGLLNLLGDGNYIINGVQVSGTQLTDGWIYYNGELLKFKGGAINSKFIIVNEEVTEDTGDFEKYAMPGTGVGDIALSSLERVSQLINLVTVQNDLSNLQILVNGLFKTGMIMPFMGTVAPSGWMLCDGRSIPDDEEHAALRSLVGNNTPNLNELTIVGAGTRNVGSILGNNEINLSVEQLPAHKHEAGTLKTTEAGNHYHQIAGEIMQKDGSSTKEVAALDTRGDPGFGTYYKNTGSAGNHLHYIDGETASAGSGTAIDIRNPSFAANFIIKI